MKNTEKTQDPRKPDPKKYNPKTLKFAEAGLLLVLVLSLSVVIGMKMYSGDGPSPVEPVAIGSVSPESELAMVVETETGAEATPAVDGTGLSAPTATPPAQTVVAETHDAYDQDVPADRIYQDGELAYFAGEYDKAADIFALYTERNAGNAWGHYMLGLSLHKAGADTDAVEALQAALQIKPDHFKSLVNLARVQLAMGDAQAALPLIGKAVELQPENADAWRMSGRVNHNLQDSDAAIAAYRSALRLDPDDAWALNNLGLVLIESGRSDEALPALARAVAVRGDVACFRNNLGIALEGCGYAVLAAETYRSVLQIDPDYARAVTSLTRVSSQQTEAILAPLDLAQLAADFTVAPLTPEGGKIAVADIEN